MRPVIVLALTLLTLYLCQTAPQIQTGDTAGVTLNLPERISVFTSQEGKPDKVELDNLPTDTQFAKRVYYTATANPDTRDIAHVSIVLAGSERRSIHRPEVCLTGQGWTITSSQVIPVQIGTQTLHVKDLAIQRQTRNSDETTTTHRAHYVYWFVGSDTTTPSHFTRVWLSTWDSVFRNINHRWAYPSILAQVTEGKDPKDTQERQRTDQQTLNLITHLIQELAPKFQTSLR